VKPFVCVSPA
jgi:hypothetical protein